MSTPSYWVESFTDEERAFLSQYVTNVDGPVFALVNLPEIVKSALFARYSRTGKSLRRLLLDEFAESLDDGSGPDPVGGDRPPTVGVRRATELYGRMFDEYGDDSVAQLGGAHVACEQSSILLTKLLERGRLASYLEQSTRYVSYAQPRDGRYRYHLDPDVDASDLGADYRRVLDGMFSTYAACVQALTEHLTRVLPQPDGTSEAAWRRSVRARALDGARGLLPAATTSNLGIFASGQAWEQLVLRLRASALPEARAYAELLLTELRTVIPVFLTRLARPDRGGAWVDYLRGTAADTDRVTAELLGAPATTPAPVAAAGPSVRLATSDPDGEDRVLAAIVYEHSNQDLAAAADHITRLSPADRDRLLAAYLGARDNRRHRPGRALEQTTYTFDVVADYGAFRDLQRHRLCTIVWQPLTPTLGYEIPPDVEEAGQGTAFGGAMTASAELYEALHARFPAQAPYAVALALRVRFLMTVNARELMHIAELRSDPSGHPTYRAVAQQMHRLIAEDAGHHRLAAAMRFVVHDDAELGRLAAEQRTEARRAAHRQPSSGQS